MPDSATCSTEPRAAAAASGDALVFRTGGFVMVVGLWFLVLGLALAGGLGALAAFAPLPAGGLGVALRAGLLLAATLPLAAAVLGFLLTLAGEVVTIDVAQREVRVRHGRWWRWKRDAHPLAAFDRVVLSHEVARGSPGSGRGHHTSSSYPVRLQGSGREIELATPGDYRAGRAVAEHVAAVLDFPLHDVTAPETVVRAAATLDESVRARAQRRGADVRAPHLPRTSRIHYATLADATRIDLAGWPRRELVRNATGVAILLGLWTAVAVPGLWMLRKSLPDGAEGAWRVAEAGLVAVPLLPTIYVGLAAVALATLRESVIVSPYVLRRVWRWGPLRWTRSLAAEEIEELLIRNGDVIARGDRGELACGMTLNRRERKWLHAALEYGLVRGPLP